MSAAPDPREAGERTALVQPDPLWRREPWRLLFPEAMLAALAGVGAWLTYGLGANVGYPSDFHAVAQIEGFLACIAAGFLFTFLPRRVGAPPATPLQVALAVLAPAVAVVAAALGAEVASQAAWLVLVGVLLAFAAPRLAAAGATLKLPNAIVWVPAGLLFGAAGAVLRVWAGAAEDVPLRLAGQGLLTQGMLTALVVGVGATLLPVLTRGVPHAETAGTARDAAAKALHLAGAAALAASFFVEAEASPRLGCAVRAAVALVTLLAAARIDRLPTVPGLHRRLVWLSAWLLPLGYALAAVTPRYEEAGLHVVYIGGFALMALSVGHHVAQAHGGTPRVLAGRPRRLVALAALVLGALVLRGIVDLDRPHERVWLALASLAFLGATACWASLVLPRLRGV
ncbi:NnrS family protein [Anaeromyxobacter diazotrophicus]|uniref:NnrS family protein n=1 Tax=Anaeromyxobacter diazotrophicus TaxID=2590199 RepID=A0A7I9VMY3_9BACT|nr:NnrS family protein [Anaeromyxobacter diazotrophicus]GEJ57741.1 hypothetical protein AMYX_24820 [Anaeromyxobacter diazotrophicus]